jgi:hypothetical protein
MAWIQMRDFWTFKPLEVGQNSKHLFECKDSKSDTGHSLLVHVAASHSAIVNGNRRFYRPDKMQESIHTWLPQKSADGTTLRTARPVLIGHDEKGDVLGRVLEAKYVDESWKYAGDFPIVKDFLFYQRDGRKRKNLYEAVDWVVDNLVPLDEYTGLGYTDLGLRITNPEAIRKVLADEYLTVSVGFRTDAAVCSLCHTDWAVDGKCGHKLGEMEDGHQMFLIAGSLLNQEVSFINFAADPFATTLSKEVMTDSLKKMFFLGLPITEQTTANADGLQLTDGLIFESDLFVAEETMEPVIDMSTLDLTALGTEVKSPELTQERAFAVRDSLAAWAPSTDELKQSKRSLVSGLNAKIRKNKWDKVQDSVTEADKAISDELNELMEDAKKKKSPAGPSGQSKGVSKKSEGAAKEFQQKEIAGKTEHDPDSKDCKCEECSTTEGVDSLTDFASWVADSDEDRDYFADGDGIASEITLELGEGAVLVADSFCGPNSTFPVPDSIHAKAARAVLGKAKFSDALKTQILANVAIKEKGFTVTSATTGTDSESELTSYSKMIDEVLMQDETKVVTLEERTALAGIIRDLDKAYKKLPVQGPQWAVRYALRGLLELWSAEENLASAMTYLTSKDHVVLTQSELDEKDEAINDLMSEKDGLVTEVKNLTDSRAIILAATKKTLAQQVVMAGVLKGQDGFKELKPEEIASKVETLAKRHITSLQDSVSDILSGLRWSDAITAASKSTETHEAVDDFKQITDETPAAASLTDGVKDEADPAHEALLKKLSYMTPLERARHVGRLRHLSAKTK